MRVSRRREREKQALRGEILAAASDLFVEQGFENVSMRKIAERIDYSPTAIYLHFRDKSELLHSICEETFQKLIATLNALMDRARERNADPVDTLRRGLRAYVTFGLEHPNHYIVTFLTRHSKDGEKGGSGEFPPSFKPTFLQKSPLCFCLIQKNFFAPVSAKIMFF